MTNNGGPSSYARRVSLLSKLVGSLQAKQLVLVLQQSGWGELRRRGDMLTGTPAGARARRVVPVGPGSRRAIELVLGVIGGDESDVSDHACWRWSVLLKEANTLFR